MEPEKVEFSQNKQYRLQSELFYFTTFLVLHKRIWYLEAYKTHL